ncbi:MAG: sulfotransferase [Planctomycetes bacterium]|nr:sulfotransferase [Planctomycetota bacterium]
MLGRIFAQHPDVAYWPEPRPIWMYRHAYRPHHELGAEDLTPVIARHIDRSFARFLARSGRSRFAEKTPSNCLRIPFIHALYPDCRIINILRDGREVVGAAFRMQTIGAHPSRLMARVRETPLWEWPAGWQDRGSTCPPISWPHGSGSAWWRSRDATVGHCCPRTTVRSATTG